MPNATFTDATLSLNANLGEYQKVQTVKPVSVTEEMTQPVGVDNDGRLYTFPSTGDAGGNDGSLPTIVCEPTSFGTNIKITDSDGLTTVTPIRNGTNGRDGVDGYSPKIQLTPADNGIRISITNRNSTSEAVLLDGAPGTPGTDGKSAYAYAQEGGYTGTEEEFAEKLAKEIPTALPNPKSFVFMDTIGTADYYNGSQEKTLLLRKAIYIQISQSEDGSWSASEDFRTITNYIGMGWTVCCVMDGNVIPLMQFGDDSVNFALTLAAGDVFLTYVVIIFPNNSVLVDMIETTSLPNPNSITINGNSYDGSEAMDFTDTINSLIDTKLGVIENGSY